MFDIIMFKKSHTKWGVGGGSHPFCGPRPLCKLWICYNNYTVIYAVRWPRAAGIPSYNHRGGPLPYKVWTTLL